MFAQGIFLNLRFPFTICVYVCLLPNSNTSDISVYTLICRHTIVVHAASSALHSLRHVTDAVLVEFGQLTPIIELNISLYVVVGSGLWAVVRAG